MSDRGEFAIGPGAAKRMRACAWPSIRPPTANLTAMGEGAWERRPFIVSADDRATGASDRSSRTRARSGRSEEHTSELQSLMRISYAVFCLKKKKTDTKSASKHKKINKNTAIVHIDVQSDN